VLINGEDIQTNITLTNDLERRFKGLHTNNYSIEYAEGLDGSFIDGSGALCLLGSAIAETYGIIPGDRISLMSNRLYFALAQIYRDDEAQLAAAVEQQSTIFRVAGVIETENAAVSFGVFAPSNGYAERVYGQPFAIEYIEFILADNERLDELRALLGRQIIINRESAPAASYHIDSTALENIKLVRDLLIQFFPIAVTAAVLIGMLGPILLIMQSEKEAALLRVLGVTKKRVRCMLMFEQIGLCVIGMFLATGVLVLYNSMMFSRNAGTLAICVALYVIGCICAALGTSIKVTKRRVLVLLQTKE
jgi:ABC-type lipoprotein release transport system permease subunit